MNAQKTTFNLKRILVLSVLVLLAANSSLLANTGDAVRAVRMAKDESIAIAAKSLSQKLKSDLVLKDVSLKLSKAEQYYVSDSQVGLRGEGICRIDGEANDLPINFDVKIDIDKHKAADVRYVFLNIEGTAGGVTVEDIVTEKLLQKIKDDFKTENVVVAIDYVSETTLENGGKGFSGSGEVRLNGMIWKKIEFIAREGDEKSNVSITKYQIK